MDMGLLRTREVGSAEHGAEVECAQTAAQECDGLVTARPLGTLAIFAHRRPETRICGAKPQRRRSAECYNLASKFSSAVAILGNAVDSFNSR